MNGTRLTAMTILKLKYNGIRKWFLMKKLSLALGTIRYKGEDEIKTISDRPGAQSSPPTYVLSLPTPHKEHVKNVFH